MLLDQHCSFPLYMVVSEMTHEQEIVSTKGFDNWKYLKQWKADIAKKLHLDRNQQ